MRAAQAIGMTQPAASKLLREIEDALQVRLFERHARGIVPTSCGEILVRHARSILSEIHLARTGDRDSQVGPFRPGIAQAPSSTPAANLVPTAIGLLKQKHPGLLVSVELDHSRPLLDKLMQGELDMLVARLLDADSPESLQFEPLEDEHHAVLVGGQHPLAGKADVQLEDLLDHPWIVPPPESALRERLTRVFLQRGLAVPANIIQTQSLSVVTHLLRATDAVAVLQREPVQFFCETGCLSVLIEDLGLEIGCFGIITRSGLKLSPGARALLGSLLKSQRRSTPRNPTARICRLFSSPTNRTGRTKSASVTREGTPGVVDYPDNSDNTL